jgi:predicted site-specific integrase-resolvase
VSSSGYLTTAEVSERFRITPKTALRWRQQGNGPGHIRAGKKILYPINEVERYERELATVAGLRPSS